MSFCTVINCMDGRVQLPVIEYLKSRFGVNYVDSINEAGPVKIIAEQADSDILNSILKRVDISVKKHNSCAISIAAHYDCAGNPIEKDQQLKQLEKSIRFVASKYPGVEVVGLWVDENFSVGEII